LFDLCAGFVYSQVLFACVELRLFERLRGGPKTVHALAHASGVPPEAMRTLLTASAALRLTQWRGEDRCGLGPHGAALLGNPALLPMIAHHALFYQDLADPCALLRGECRPSRLSAFWSYARSADPRALPGDGVRPYTSLMSASQALLGADILAAYSLAPHKCLLDVGGGDGTFALMAAEDARALRVICFDLPAVTEFTRERFARSQCADRLSVAAGDFLSDPLPQGADVISLIRVLHDHDDHAVRRILLAARAALAPGGALLIAEPLAGTRGAERVGDAYFGLYLLAMGSGKPRTVAQLSQLIVAAGFAAPRLRATRMPMNTEVLVARPKL
jgi:demethylspheroidene O-methyltransferase